MSLRSTFSLPEEEEEPVGVVGLAGIIFQGCHCCGGTGYFPLLYQQVTLRVDQTQLGPLMCVEISDSCVKEGCLG